MVQPVSPDGILEGGASIREYLPADTLTEDREPPAPPGRGRTPRAVGQQGSCAIVGAEEEPGQRDKALNLRLRTRVFLWGIRIFRTFSLLLLLALPGLAQDLQGRCTHLQGDEYLCKCTSAKGYVTATAATAKTAMAPATGAAAVEPTPAPAIDSAAAKSATQSEPPTGETTATGKPIYEGPRGGRYHYSSSGKKVYAHRRKQ